MAQQNLVVLKRINNNLSIVIGNDFVEKKLFSPVISNYGKLYKMDGTPLQSGNRLYARTLEEVNGHMDDARKQFDIVCGGAPAPVSSPAVPTPATVQTSPAYDAFQTLMFEAIGKVATAQIMENVIPLLEEHIRNTYGNLPTIHEFRLPAMPPKQESQIYHKKFDTMMKLILKGRNVYLFGPAGTGKSHIASQIAEILNLPFYPQSKIDIAYDITGFNDATGKFVETNFYKAWKNGGVFLLDELDRSDPTAVIVLNNALASKQFTFACGTVERHKDFHCVATGNTIGTGANMQYATAQKMDESTRNRFYFFKVDYDEQLELMFAKGDKELVEFAHDFRIACDKIGYEAIFSYRDIERIVESQELFEDMDIKEMFEMVSFVSIDVDTKKQIFLSLKNQNNKYAKSLQ